MDHDGQARSMIHEKDYRKFIGHIILSDPLHFEIRPEFTLEALAKWREKLWARQLPQKHRFKKPFLAAHCPHLYFNLKRKCWAGSQLTCTKPNHVHTRNVTSTATNHPQLKAHKRRVMRAYSELRRVEAGYTYQIWGISNMTEHLGDVVKGLARIAEFEHICICHREPKDPLTICQVDANAFYENANATRACVRALGLSTRVGHKLGKWFASVSQDGKRAVLGQKTRGSASRNDFYVYHFNDMNDTLNGAREDSFFRVGENLVIKRRNSWPMGGEESAEAVALDSHASEYEVHISDIRQKGIGWHYPPLSLKQLIGGARVQDNVLLASHTLCQRTMVDGAKALYPPDFGMDLEAEGPVQPYLMARIETTPDGALLVFPSSHNSKFARFQKSTQTLTRLEPCFGPPITPLAHLHQFLAQATARYRQLTRRDSMCSYEALLDLHWECRRLGYSHQVLEKYFRSLPPARATPAVQLLRSSLKAHRVNVIAQGLEEL